MAKTKTKTGRPRKEIDWEVVNKLLHIQCTGEEIAAFLDISYDTIERACKRKFKKAFADYSAEKREGGKCSLRRRQWILAETSVPMAIFLGKNYLGQTDRQTTEISGPGGKPIEMVTRQEIKKELSQLADDELDTLVRIAEKIAAKGNQQNGSSGNSNKTKG